MSRLTDCFPCFSSDLNVVTPNEAPTEAIAQHEIVAPVVSDPNSTNNVTQVPSEAKPEMLHLNSVREELKEFIVSVSNDSTKEILAHLTVFSNKFDVNDRRIENIESRLSLCEDVSQTNLADENKVKPVIYSPGSEDHRMLLRNSKRVGKLAKR